VKSDKRFMVEAYRYTVTGQSINKIHFMKLTVARHFENMIYQI